MRNMVRNPVQSGWRAAWRAAKGMKAVWGQASSESVLPTCTAGPADAFPQFEYCQTSCFRCKTCFTLLQPPIQGCQRRRAQRSNQRRRRLPAWQRTISTPVSALMLEPLMLQCSLPGSLLVCTHASARCETKPWRSLLHDPWELWTSLTCWHCCLACRCP